MYDFILKKTIMHPSNDRRGAAEESSGDGGGGDRPRPTRRRAACTFNRGNVQGSRGESWAHGSCTFGLKASPRPSFLGSVDPGKGKVVLWEAVGWVGDSRFLDTPILQEASLRVNRGGEEFAAEL